MKERKGKKKGFLRENYKESLDYVRVSKNFIYSVIIIFLFFFFIGFFIKAPGILEERILEFIKELLKKTADMSQPELTRFIFFNNLQSSFMGMLFGIVLGIFPVLTMLANGYLLGFIAEKTVGKEGIFILWRLFPHGIFELPALFISLGLGLKLGTFVFKKNKLKVLSTYLLKSIKVFFFIVIPLLIIAAIIEAALIFFLG